MNQVINQPTSLISRTSWISAVLCLVGCSFQNFDYLQEGIQTSEVGGATGVGGSAVGASSAGGASVTALGGSSGGGASNSGGAATGGTSASPPTIGPWEFNSESDISVWQPSTTDFPAGSSISWAAEGEVAPLGSMVITATGPTIVSDSLPTGTSDQSSRTIYFRARAASGNAILKPFATSSGYVWADGGEQPVTTAWSTVTMKFNTPTYQASGFDPSALISVGLQIPCPGTAANPVTWVVWIDRGWVQ